VTSAAVLGLPLTHYTVGSAIDDIAALGSSGHGGYVCLASVYMVMEALDDPALFAVVADADIVLPDGMPLAWSLRADGFPDAERVAGMELTMGLLEEAGRRGMRVGFRGAEQAVLDRLRHNVTMRWPELKVVYLHSPPFRTLTEDEIASEVAAVAASGCQILFVGLGCPKQELWMAANRDRILAVMIGVGAVFDFLAGTKRRAPVFLQRLGLEWLFRFALEPKRLFRRYMFHNPRFVWRIAMERMRKGANAR